jgi:hypothetical protein
MKLSSPLHGVIRLAAAGAALCAIETRAAAWPPSGMPIVPPWRVVPVYEGDDDDATNGVTRAIANGEADRLLVAAYPAFLRDARWCKGIDGDLDARRAAGDFVPHVEARARGAFTAKGISEVLYLVSLNECGASHADNWGSMELVVLRGGAIVARAGVEGGSGLARVADIDGDGRDDVLLTWSYGHMGISMRTARLVNIEPARLAVVEDFDEVEGSNCLGIDKEKLEWSVRIDAIVRPGARVAFRRTRSARACPKDP